MTAQDLLRTDPIIRDAFQLCYAGKLKRSLDDTINTLSAPQWRMFVKSAAGKKAAEITGIYLDTVVVAAPGPSQHPVHVVSAQPPVPVPPTTRICVGCGATIPVGVSRLCEDCERPADVVAPAATPAPVPPVTPMPDSTDPLALLRQLMTATGYVPQQAITAQRCEEIAYEQAYSVVEMVIEDLEKQGKLGGGRKEVIELRAPGLPTRQVEGHVPAWFPRLVKLHACRVPALLVGPAGSGKTTAAAKLAELVGVPFYRISMAAGVDEGTLQGWLLPKQGMNFEYVQSMVSKAYEAEEGGVVLLDDIDLSDPNMLGIANAILDNGGWYVPLRHEDPFMKKSDNFYVMAASNTMGHGADRQYVGANQLDERTLSRFRAGQIPCDYDEDLERQLFSTHPDYPAEAQISVAYGHRLRARLRALQGQHRDVSTRDIETRWKMLGQFSVEEAWYGQFVDWSADERGHVHVTVNHHTMTATLE